MNSLKFFQKEINNCSRCGLCQAVCPIFEETKNDCASPKGILIMLKNLINSEEKPSKKLKKYINMCLKCQKCHNFCPSKIKITQIIQEYEKNYPSISSTILNTIENWIFPLQKIKITPENYQNKKIIYIKSHKENLPENIKNSDFIIIEEFSFSLNFIFHNPKLASKIMENITQKIIKQNPDLIITRCPLCKIQLKLKLLQKKSSIKMGF